MGIFSNLSANRKIIKRLELLEEDSESCRKASRDLRNLELEFSNLWGKVNTALGRIEKRASVAERLHAKIQSAENTEEGDDGTSAASPSPVTDELTPRQQYWQRLIAAERSRRTS